MEIHRIAAEHTGKYGTLLEVIKKKLRWCGHMGEQREPWQQTPSCRVKLRGYDHEEGQQVVGRCKRMDRAELE